MENIGGPLLTWHLTSRLYKIELVFLLFQEKKSNVDRDSNLGPPDL